MKTLFLAILVSLSATAFAHDEAAYGTEEAVAIDRVVTSCSDHVLFKRFKSEEQAYAHCGSLVSNYQLSIGVTYDWGYRAYTCSCYNNDNGGGSN
jgi:hypothetical protein